MIDQKPRTLSERIRLNVFNDHSRSPTLRQTLDGTLPARAEGVQQ